MNMRFYIPICLAIVMIFGLFTTKLRLSVRVVACLCFVLACLILGIVGILTLDRLAESTLLASGQRPSQQWLEGALATRNAGRLALVFWLSAFSVLAVLSVYLYSAVLAKNARQDK
jgi:hypothetical protein